MKCFERLVMSHIKGHGGKGNIFIWASGNGGLANDHCGADGYVNSIYTVATGAVTKLGLWTFN
ncbi:PCSK4 convertase, partial [Atractosteus spatula]|nr:PCSK4 convertase [Atractosteus spatula]